MSVKSSEGRIEYAEPLSEPVPRRSASMDADQVLEKPAAPRSTNSDRRYAGVRSRGRSLIQI